MKLAHFALTVRDYDEAIAFYVGTLGFALLEDTPLEAGKRWVRVGPPGGGAALLLARAVGPRQEASVGNQAGGRVFVFLETHDFRADYLRLLDRGVTFVRPPTVESWGAVAVFADLYGNLIDLVEPGSPTPRPWLLVAGPYSSGAADAEERAARLRALNRAALAVFERGWQPMIGVNLALPIIEVAGPQRFGELMMPMSLALTERCDAGLRLAGPSAGADEEVERLRAAGKPVWTNVEDVPTR